MIGWGCTVFQCEREAGWREGKGGEMEREEVNTLRETQWFIECPRVCI
jgi:hypothetical protein